MEVEQGGPSAERGPEGWGRCRLLAALLLSFSAMMEIVWASFIHFSKLSLSARLGAGGTEVRAMVLQLSQGHRSWGTDPQAANLWPAAPRAQSELRPALTYKQVATQGSEGKRIFSKCSSPGGKTELDPGSHMK